MENKDLIQKLNNQLKKGDRISIVALTGIDKAVVSRFMNGKEENISDERATAIIDAALNVISKRAELNKANERKITKALKTA